MTATSLNSKFRHLALLQGVVDYSNWPIHTYAGQTGDEHAYGWKHDHLVTQEYVNYALQCYGMRPVYYKDAPVRETGYHKGGRPLDWTPEDDGNDPNDLTNGDWLAPDGTPISGLDLVHFPLSPLVSIARSKGFVVNTDKGPLPAETVAMQMLCFLADAHVGMVRQVNGQPSSYLGPDRLHHYTLRDVVDGLKMGYMLKDDAASMSDYIKETVLPRWLQLPYLSLTRVYNGLYWVLAALWDAYMIAPDGDKAILQPHLEAKAACCLQLVKALPGKACTVKDVSQWGPDMAIVDAMDHYGPWGIRAQLVAGKILGGDDGKLCHDEAMQEFAKWNGKPEGPSKVEWKTWSVDVAGNYLWS